MNIWRGYFDFTTIKTGFVSDCFIRSVFQRRLSSGKLQGSEMPGYPHETRVLFEIKRTSTAITVKSKKQLSL